VDLIIIFLSGLFTALGPCVITILPIALTYTFGVSKNRFDGLIISITFVLGFALLFSLMGALSSYIGNILSLYYLKYIAAFITIFFGIILLLGGNLKFTFRSSKIGLERFINKIKEDIPMGYKVILSFIIGIVYGFSANVCADPVLASILSYTATKGDVIFGFISLFVYSIGFGIPIILLSIISVESKMLIMEKIGKRGNIINKLSGALLILLGFYIFVS